MTIGEARIQIEQLLGWQEGDSDCFSLPTLRELVRGKDPKFDADLASFLDSGKHLFAQVSQRDQARLLNPGLHRIDYPKKHLKG